MQTTKQTSAVQITVVATCSSLEKATVEKQKHPGAWVQRIDSHTFKVNLYTHAV